MNLDEVPAVLDVLLPMNPFMAGAIFCFIS